MSYLIRQAERGDVARLEELLRAYMRETYHGAWGGTAQRLERHAFGAEVEIIVAQAPDGAVCALAAWVRTYDLHYCMKGGEVIDLYVCPPHRGRGVALLLLVGVAASIREREGTYLKGGPVDDAAVRRLYRRVAMCFPGGDCYVSGRAFRHLAGLSGRSLREMVGDLPETGWNHEP